MEPEDIMTANGLSVEVISCSQCFALVAASDELRHIRWHGKCPLCNYEKDTLKGELYCPEHTRTIT